MGEFINLINIGKSIDEQLEQVGITTYEQLKKTGSKDSWLKIKAIDASAWINRLYALEGAVQGIKKTQLSIEKKEELNSL